MKPLPATAAAGILPSSPPDDLSPQGAGQLSSGADAEPLDFPSAQNPAEPPLGAESLGDGSSLAGDTANALIPTLPLLMDAADSAGQPSSESLIPLPPFSLPFLGDVPGTPSSGRPDDIWGGPYHPPTNADGSKIFGGPYRPPEDADSSAITLFSDASAPSDALLPNSSSDPNLIYDTQPDAAADLPSAGTSSPAFSPADLPSGLGHLQPFFDSINASGETEGSADTIGFEASGGASEASPQQATDSLSPLTFEFAEIDAELLHAIRDLPGEIETNVNQRIAEEIESYAIRQSLQRAHLYG